MIYIFLIWFTRCSYAEDENIDQADGINTSGFYLLMGTAQVLETGIKTFCTVQLILYAIVWRLGVLGLLHRKSRMLYA